MPQHTRLDAYPQRIRFGPSGAEQVYERVPGYYAEHARPAGSPAPGAVFTLNEQTIAVYKGTPAEANRAEATTWRSPVYAAQPNGPHAVPTGRIFLRFTEGVDAAVHRDALGRAGYAIERQLPYAMHAAWLRDRDGNAARALANLNRLQTLQDVENVEPQLLMPAMRRA
jgi:hypothetical protein